MIGNIVSQIAKLKATRSQIGQPTSSAPGPAAAGGAPGAASGGPTINSGGEDRATALVNLGNLLIEETMGLLNNLDTSISESDKYQGDLDKIVSPDQTVLNHLTDQLELDGSKLSGTASAVPTQTTAACSSNEQTNKCKNTA